MFINKARQLLCTNAGIVKESNQLLGNIIFREMSVNVEAHSTACTNNEDLLNSNNKRPLITENVVDDKSKIQKLEPEIKEKKKNYVIMLSYNGKGYYGMQRNTGLPTIEGVLMKALLDASLITQEAYDDPKIVHFQRAARTDKGVSAMRQVVNLMMPGHKADAKEINGYLPNEIKVFGIKRVTKGFNSKNQCNARTYAYVIPTYAFASEGPLPIERETLESRLEKLHTIDGKPYHEYRLPAEGLERLNSILKLFEGTHNFHNYTSKVKSLDPRAKRYILKCACARTFVSNGMEFAQIEIKGQSFMLHQIRKMIAFALVIMRDIIPQQQIDETFEHPKYDIPRAPSLGLVLNYIHYDNYDRRYGEDGMHEKLDWAEFENDITTFWENQILPHMVQTEIDEKSTLNWLGSLHEHSFNREETCVVE